MKRHIVQTSVTILLILLLEHSTAKTITKREEHNDGKITTLTHRALHSDNGNGAKTANYQMLDNKLISQNDGLLKETAAAKGMDPFAIDELLRTNDTVVRNFTDNEGYKHSTSYSRTPDGGIVRNTFKEKTGSVLVPLNDLLKHNEMEVPGFGPIPIPTEEILKSDKPITRSKSYVDSNGNTIRTTFEIQKEPVRQTPWPNWSTDYNTASELNRSPVFMPHPINKDVDVFEPRRSPAITTPSVFDNSPNWHVNPFYFNNEPHKPEIFTKHTTTKDDNGNTVTTNVTRKTYTFPTFSRPSIFDDFYTSTTTQRPFKAISIDDLPVTNILQNGKPVDTDFINKLPEALRPVTQTELTSTKTTKVNNIPMTSFDEPQFQQNPDLQEALLKAGITPDDIRASNGEPIVKIRVEPDGKIVRTTYRVNTIPTHTYSPVYPFDDFKPYPKYPFTDDFDGDSNKWLTNTSYKPTTTTTTTPKPKVYNEIIDLPVRWQWKLVPEITPTVREHIEKAGISNNEIEQSYNKPIVKTRLDINGNLVRTTYNLVDFTREPSKISDYLLRVDLHPDDILLRSSHGITKTIIEENGRILIAKFNLILPLNVQSGNASGNNTTEKSLSSSLK